MARADLGGQPRTRSAAAQAAWNRPGGRHGGTSKQQIRQDRKAVKVSLREERSCSS